MILLGLLTLIIFGGSLLVQRSNAQTEQSNILYPFSGYLSPSSNSSTGKWTVNTSRNNVGTGEQPEDGLFLAGMAGGEKNSVPQMQCPTGYRINVVSAFLEVADPYGECSSSPTSTLKLSCGDSSDKSGATTCKTGNDSECGPGMTCPAGKCVPKTCKSNASCASSSTAGTIQACPANLGMKGCTSHNSCGDPTLVCMMNPGDTSGVCQLDPGASGSCMACVDGNGNPGSDNGTCSTFPACANTIGGINTFCSPEKGDTFRCRPRDASAYLARHCDGKSFCLGGQNDKWDPNALGGVFGPLPCQIPAYSASKEYASLPISTGWAGGSPLSGDGGNAPATFHQGYYVHGIYGCVPEDADVVPS